MANMGRIMHDIWRLKTLSTRTYNKGHLHRRLNTRLGKPTRHVSGFFLFLLSFVTMTIKQSYLRTLLALFTFYVRGNKDDPIFILKTSRPCKIRFFVLFPVATSCGQTPKSFDPNTVPRSKQKPPSWWYKQVLGSISKLAWCSLVGQL